MYSEAKKKKYKACLRYDEETNKIILDFSNNEPVEFCTCPKCSGKVLKLSGKYGDFYKCNTCGMILNGSYAGKKFSKNEIERLLQGQKVKGSFKSKNNKKFSATVKLVDGKLEMEF